MTTIYVTGTCTPGAALRRFLPDYLDLLLHRGDKLITTNKPGVDAFVIQHCDQHHLPLQIYEFASNSHSRRQIKPHSEAVQVQRIISPTWQRFRHLADTVEKMIFFHAAKTRRKCYGLPILTAFEVACQKRGLAGEQWIIQEQQQAWVRETELRQAPIIGAVHIYVNSRVVSGLGQEQHAVARFRLGTWRKLGEIVQPGIGRREFVLPHTSRDQALLQMLHQALLELKDHRPERLIIHHSSKCLAAAPHVRKSTAPYLDLRQQVRPLLDLYSQVIWQYEQQATVLQQIGQMIPAGQALWDHQRKVTAYRGLYQ